VQQEQGRPAAAYGRRDAHAGADADADIAMLEARKK
jgi:hypothetical protein